MYDAERSSSMTDSSKRPNIKLSFNPVPLEETKEITNQMVDHVKETLNELITDSVSKVNSVNLKRFEEKEAALEREYQEALNELVTEYEEKKRTLEKQIAIKEQAILRDAKLQAESILQKAFDESNEMYGFVQNEITELKDQLIVYQKEMEQEKIRQDSELANRLDELNKIYEAKHRQLEEELVEREQALLKDAKIEAEKTKNEAKKESTELLDETKVEVQDLKELATSEIISDKAAHQAKVSDDFLRLNKEKEWFSLYQEQVEERYADKEQKLYQKTQAELDQLELKVHELQNQTDFYQDIDEQRKEKSFSTGLYICLIAAVNVILLSVFRQATVILPILTAILGCYLIYTTLTDGRFEKKTKKVAKKNEWLIEKNDQFKKQIQDLETQIADLTAENSSLAENIQTHAELIKTVQSLENQLEEEQIDRKLIESENMNLRQRLMENK